jgi:hypothetical protein
LDFDLERLEERMLANETAGKKTIVAVGFGEVNTYVCFDLIFVINLSRTWGRLTSSLFGFAFAVQEEASRCRSRNCESCATGLEDGFTSMQVGTSTNYLLSLLSSHFYADSILPLSLSAFGGFAALLPRLSHFTEHLSLADSITLDGHKWYDPCSRLTEST